MIYIDEPEALYQMSCVEGAAWRKYQLKPRENDITSFRAFYRAWYRLPKRDRSLPSKQELRIIVYGDDGATNDAIYGDHGYARYAVRYSGAILFLEAFSPSKAHTELARATGFLTIY